MSAVSDGEPQRLYHDRTQLWRKLGAAAYVTFLPTVWPIVAVISGHDRPALILVVAGAGTVIVATASVLVFSSGFRLGANGVTIVNPIGIRRHLPWSQIRMFQVKCEPTQRWSRVRYGVWIVRHDAWDLTTSSCCRTVPLNKNSCPEGITRLAADLEAERQRLGQTLAEAEDA